LPPERVVGLLNRYLSTMVSVIKQYQGTIDEFIGDAIFVLFGAPVWQEDDAERAVACAVAMQLAMSSINEQNQKEDLPELEMGIGIHTGPVVVGTWEIKMSLVPEPRSMVLVATALLLLVWNRRRTSSVDISK
jgi:adenylate cyclase